VLAANPTTSCSGAKKTAKGTDNWQKPDRLAGFAASPVFPTMVCEEKDLHDRDGSEQVLFYLFAPRVIPASFL